MNPRRERNGRRPMLFLGRLQRRLPQLVLDEPIVLGRNNTRLIVAHDDGAGPDHLALIVGDIAAGDSFTIRTVSEETLLLEGSRSVDAPQVLIGEPLDPAPRYRRRARPFDGDAFVAGIVRRLRASQPIDMQRTCRA